MSFFFGDGAELSTESEFRLKEQEEDRYSKEVQHDNYLKSIADGSYFNH